MIRCFVVLCCGVALLCGVVFRVVLSLRWCVVLWCVVLWRLVANCGVL